VWRTEHNIETGADPQAVWGIWSDVARWPEWNTDLERAEISGPFTAGSTVTMFPRTGEPIELQIANAVAPEMFVDEANPSELWLCGRPIASIASTASESGSSTPWK
jgi:hypothetical protein